MGRAPCCDKANVKKGPWSPEEDAKLKDYIEKHGTGGNWIALPQKAGLRRCGKSCRLRWLNYLRPNIKHGEFTDNEDRIICTLFASIGSRWSIIAAQLPGRTDNDIKNYWNTKLKKKLMGMNPSSQRKPHPHAMSPFLQSSSSSSSSSPSSFKGSNTNYSQFSFNGMGPISYSSGLLSSNRSTSAASVIQIPQESFVGPAQHYQVRDNLLMFGAEASCSSSDGSCNNNNQISHGREIEFENVVCGGNKEQMGMQSYLYSAIEEGQRLMVSDGASINGWNDAEKQNVMFQETPLDYSLEEIKRLISTSSCSNFLFDESKAEERVMYF